MGTPQDPPYPMPPPPFPVHDPDAPPDPDGDDPKPDPRPSLAKTGSLGFTTKTKGRAPHQTESLQGVTPCKLVSCRHN